LFEKAQEGKNTILSWFGKGDLAKAKKELASRDEQIAKLKNQIKTLMSLPHTDLFAVYSILNLPDVLL